MIKLYLIVVACTIGYVDSGKHCLMSLSLLLDFICLPFCFFLLLIVADPPFKTCTRTWRKVGCFKDLKGGQRALKEQLVNIRDLKSKVFPVGEPKLSWNHLTQSFHR